MLVTIGRDNAEGLRTAYQRQAFATMAARASSRSTITSVLAQPSKLVTGTARVPLNTSSFGARLQRKSRLLHKSTAQASTGRKLLSLSVDRETDPDTQPTEIMTELLILLPTFIRRNLDDNTEYVAMFMLSPCAFCNGGIALLSCCTIIDFFPSCHYFLDCFVFQNRYLRKVLTSLDNQYTGQVAERKVQVLVVNNSPNDHRGVDTAIEQVLSRKGQNSTLRVSIVDGGDEFDDPFDADLRLKVKPTPHSHNAIAHSVYESLHHYRYGRCHHPHYFHKPCSFHLC